jgi:hypothetical protein
MSRNRSINSSSTSSLKRGKDDIEVPDNSQKKRRGVIAEDSLINRLSQDEVETTWKSIIERYHLVTTNDCSIIGPKKSNGKMMATRAGGYLQISVQGVKSNSQRWAALNFSEAAGKVDWHHIVWRKHNPGKLIPSGEQVCHLCPNKACCIGAHYICGSRALNESHKLCRYVYLPDTIEPDGYKFYLQCSHQPPCRPKLEALPLQAIPTDHVGVKQHLLRNLAS